MHAGEARTAARRRGLAVVALAAAIVVTGLASAPPASADEVRPADLHEPRPAGSGGQQGHAAQVAGTGPGPVATGDDQRACVRQHVEQGLSAAQAQRECGGGEAAEGLDGPGRDVGGYLDGPLGAATAVEPSGCAKAAAPLTDPTRSSGTAPPSDDRPAHERVADDAAERTAKKTAQKAAGSPKNPASNGEYDTLNSDDVRKQKAEDVTILAKPQAKAGVQAAKALEGDTGATSSAPDGAKKPDPSKQKQEEPGFWSKVFGEDDPAKMKPIDPRQTVRRPGVVYRTADDPANASGGAVAACEPESPQQGRCGTDPGVADPSPESAWDDAAPSGCIEHGPLDGVDDASLERAITLACSSRTRPEPGQDPCAEAVVAGAPGIARTACGDPEAMHDPGSTTCATTVDVDALNAVPDRADAACNVPEQLGGPRVECTTRTPGPPGGPPPGPEQQ